MSMTAQVRGLGEVQPKRVERRTGTRFAAWCLRGERYIPAPSALPLHPSRASEYDFHRRATAPLVGAAPSNPMLYAMLGTAHRSRFVRQLLTSLGDKKLATAFTHGAVGAALGQLLPPGIPTKRFTAVLVIASILPDVDIIAFPLGIPYSDPLGHRGFTHSILFAGILAVIVVGLLWALRVGTGPGRVGAGLVTFSATVSHGLLDAATDAGLGVGFFIPLDNERYFLPFRPLDTSSVSPGAFLGDPARALDILANELTWVGVPLIALTITLHAFKFFRKSHR